MIVFPDSKVSIHAPARGATPACIRAGRLWLFQSTPPRGGRHIAGKELISRSSFNPRPRAGGDAIEGKLAPAQYKVSIHAPARGATRNATGIRMSNLVSIHAPARGATWQDEPERVTKTFQSTPPRGGRLQGASR